MYKNALAGLEVISKSNEVDSSESRGICSCLLLSKKNYGFMESFL